MQKQSYFKIFLTAWLIERDNKFLNSTVQQSNNKLIIWQYEQLFLVCY